MIVQPALANGGTVCREETDLLPLSPSMEGIIAVKKLVALIFAIGVASAATAQQTAPDFATLDIDGSGDVSFEEALAVWPAVTAEQFATIDSDLSGNVSPDEFLVLLDTVALAH